ncbi:putative membrane protein [Rhodopirellula maiorica SM1]|uniref:Putative membrane protein n=1 Tax=Rhodopirellula maiorica SM1 TaxID=1265738 RepID=M5RP35_9BACT|nr:hypothetical protein [Rhodopirellula maiorica]EMI15724.1 putative membrane protein [Rhodopirellula maiorica SM1]
MKHRMIQVELATVAATTIGLCVVLLLGYLSWPLARGVLGIGTGTLVAAMVAWGMRSRLESPPSMVASGGGAMACFFAIASAEMVPAGSIQWMVQGGIYGACFGIPVAFLLGPLGLINPPSMNDSP